jgi:hypothetical protein
MADPTPDTNPAAPGSSTSEFKLTIVAFVIGSLLELAAGIMHSIQDAGQGASWFPMVFSVLGALTQILGLFGYQKGRAVVKASLIAADAPSPK